MAAAPSHTILLRTRHASASSNDSSSTTTTSSSSAAVVLVEDSDKLDQKNSIHSSNIQKDNDETKSRNDNEEEDDYEYIEYEILTETEFEGSEWLVGTNWDSQKNRIDETWVRLAVDADSKQVAVWGDGSQGVWKLDVASQFLSISKESVLWGKNIWACTVDDYYYLQGTVRGWQYWSPAAVVGQWQAKRLGLTDPTEAGTPPWFETEKEENTVTAETEMKNSDTDTEL